MKVSNVVKTAVKLAPIVIPIVKKVMAAKKGQRLQPPLEKINSRRIPLFWKYAFYLFHFKVGLTMSIQCFFYM